MVESKIIVTFKLEIPKKMISSFLLILSFSIIYLLLQIKFINSCINTHNTNNST